MRKSLGIWILLLGIIGIIGSFMMNVTNGEYYNMGLLNMRSNIVIISCFGCIGGLLVILFGINDRDAEDNYRNFKNQHKS